MNELQAPSSKTSSRMARIGQRDTAAELAVRRLLHAAGLRYRVQFPVPERPRRTIDIAFTRLRIAVFVDGCFWHGCPLHATHSKTNADWWRTKLTANHDRDVDTNDALTNAGWQVLRVWEHVPPEVAAEVIQDTVLSRLSSA